MPAGLCLFALLAVADDRETAARAALKEAKVTPVAMAEAGDVRLFTTTPQARAAALAAAAQKAHAAAVSVLKKSGDLWGGKLTVYAVTDGRQTRALLLFGLKEVGSRETVRIDPKADTPYVLVGVSPGEKRTDAQYSADVAAQVATAVLVKTAGDGADLPAWLRVGFGRAVQVRSEGAKAVAAQRAKVKALAARPDAKMSPADVWEGSEGPESEVRAAAFVDYLVYGPPADKFGAFVAAFKPTEELREPNTQTAMTAAGWKAEWLADSFKAWLLSGK